MWFASATGGEADVADQAAVDATVAAVAADPIVGPNVLTDDSTTTAVFVPSWDKSAAADVESIVDGFVEVTPALADTDVHVAGLLLAEEVFGQEMSIQMGVFAPLAGLLVFAHAGVLQAPPAAPAAMAVAVLSIAWTMGLLIGTGNTAHIMSSMIRSS
ncbi:MAG: hypothetical protein R2716_02045 [Microthrixaceae bacterium]